MPGLYVMAYISAGKIMARMAGRRTRARALTRLLRDVVNSNGGRIVNTAPSGCRAALCARSGGRLLSQNARCNHIALPTARLNGLFLHHWRAFMCGGNF